MNRRCDLCRKEYEAKRPSSKYCSTVCRNRKARGADAPEGVVIQMVGEQSEGITTAAVRQELATAGRDRTYLGAAAIMLAQRIDEATAVMGFAGLVKQLEETMESAMKGVHVKGNPVIDLWARVDAKRSG